MTRACCCAHGQSSGHRTIFDPRHVSIYACMNLGKSAVAVIVEQFIRCILSSITGHGKYLIQHLLSSRQTCQGRCLDGSSLYIQLFLCNNCTTRCRLSIPHGATKNESVPSVAKANVQNLAQLRSTQCYVGERKALRVCGQSGVV